MKLNNLSKKQLYERAKELGIKGRGRMTKSQLISAISQVLMPNKLVEKSVDETRIHFYQLGYESAKENDEKQGSLQENIELPVKYNFDYIFVLPVNPSSVHVFWEVTEKTIKTIAYENNISELFLCLRILSDNDEFIIKDISDMGNYYFSQEALIDKNVWAEIGLLSGREFYAISVSNYVKMPSNYVSIQEDVVFMQVKENIAKIIDISLGNDEHRPDSSQIAKNFLKTIYSSNKIRGEK